MLCKSVGALAIAAAASLELSVVSFPPGSCTVVLTPNHQKTAERGRLYLYIHKMT